jgi:hypothetical protein
VRHRTIEQLPQGAENFIMTSNGPFRFFHPESLTSEELPLIARSLATTNRYRGLFRFEGHFLPSLKQHQHTVTEEGWYSVAEHCVKGVTIMEDYLRGENLEEDQEERMKLLWLLHDAPEAFIGDIPAPIKVRLLVDRPEGTLTKVQDLENGISLYLHLGLNIIEPVTPHEKGPHQGGGPEHVRGRVRTLLRYGDAAGSHRPRDLVCPE